MMMNTSRASLLILDDDPEVTSSLSQFLATEGFATRQYRTAADLLDHYEAGQAACIISDLCIGSENGFDVARELRNIDPAISIIFMTGWPCTKDAVDAVKLQDGIDDLEKPLDLDRLVSAVREAVDRNGERRNQLDRHTSLTKREREVFELLVKGHTTKSIAKTLCLSPRTIEDYRQQVFAKTGATTLAALFALAVSE